MSFCWLWTIQKIIVTLITLSRSNCFLDGCFLNGLLLTFSLSKAPLGETGCLIFWLLVDSPLFFQDSQSGHLWLPTPHCAAPGLTGRHATPEVTGTSHPPFTVSAADFRERFLISGIFYPGLLPAAFKVSLGPAVHPQR